MPIPFTCPHCNKHTVVADQYAGQTGPCVSCGQQVTIPSLPAGTRSTAPPRNVGGVLLFVVLTAVAGLILLVVAGVAVYMPAARTARVAARSAASMNNMRQLSIAMHNYHAVHKSLPPAYIADAKGKRLHSWRTMILPFIEQAALHKRVDFSKSWDAAENRFIRSVQIPVYRSPSAPAAKVPTATNYFLITGKGTAFEGGASPSFKDFRNGLSQTAVFVEAYGLGVEWSDPQDIDIDDLVKQIQSGALVDGRGMVRIGMADGSVRMLSKGQAITTLQNMARVADGK